MAPIRQPGNPIPSEAITAPHSTCTRCTWAWARGVMRLKYVSRACLDHRHLLDGVPDRVLDDCIRVLYGTERIAR